MKQSSAVLVITGAAATGKSTIGDHLRQRLDLLVIDGDVLGRGAAATAYGRRDYVEFWRFVLAVCREVRSNGLVPVVPCICLPDQVLAATTDEVVHFLALVSDEQTVRRRIAGRQGVSEVPSPETHILFDHRLRGVGTLPDPHTWAQHDVVTSDVDQTRAVGAAWADRVIGLAGTSSGA